MNLLNKQKAGRFLGGILLLLVVIILAGCCTPQQVVVTKTVYKVVETPDTLLIKCEATAPPNKEAFATMSDSDKKKALTELSNKLYGDLESCNGQIRSIKSFQDKEKKSVEEANKKAAK